MPQSFDTCTDFMVLFKTFDKKNKNVNQKNSKTKIHYSKNEILRVSKNHGNLRK